MGPTVARLGLLSHFNVRRTPSAATLKDAMVGFVLLVKVKVDSLVSLMVIVRTIKFVKMQFAWLVATLLGFLTTK